MTGKAQIANLGTMLIHRRHQSFLNGAVILVAFLLINETPSSDMVTPLRVMHINIGIDRITVNV